MLRKASELQGIALQATDGDIGSLRDLYFDDVQWKVRYFVADTGGWLENRAVLISPESLTDGGLAEDRLPVTLTQSEVKNSPGIETNLPVSRQHEEDVVHYFGWPVYWRNPMVATSTAAVERPALISTSAEHRGDPHLRSAAEVVGYYVEAQDGRAGSVADLILDDRDWRIRYLVVDTGTWWPGQKFLVAPDWAIAVDWPQSTVHVSLSQDEIRSGPRYDPSAPLERGYEDRLYSHYRRRGYWSE